MIVLLKSTLPEGKILYPNQTKIAVRYVCLVDDLPGYFRISVPELFPIVPVLFPRIKQGKATLETKTSTETPGEAINLDLPVDL